MHFGASAGWADARRRDAGDAVSSSRSGNAADARATPEPEGHMGSPPSQSVSCRPVDLPQVRRKPSYYRVQLEVRVKWKCDSMFGGAKKICHLSFVNGHFPFGRCMPMACSVLIEVLENTCNEYSSGRLKSPKWQLIIDK